MEIKKAVFLDKDGTLIPDVPYNVDPDLIRLSPSIIIGLKRLMKAGYQLIVISNQPGIALGYFKYHDLQAVEQKIDRLLRTHGIYLSGFYFCPHHPGGNVKEYSITCNCRKPKSGLLKTAAKTHRIDLSSSWIIGDILNDIEAGNRAGCGTIMIDNGNETEWEVNDMRTPDFIAQNINQAANYIVDFTQKKTSDESRLLFNS